MNFWNNPPDNFCAVPPPTMPYPGHLPGQLPGQLPGHPLPPYRSDPNYPAGIPGLDVDKSYEEIVQMTEEADVMQYQDLFASSTQNIPGLDLVDIASPATLLDNDDMSLSPEPPQMEPFFSDNEEPPTGLFLPIDGENAKPQREEDDDEAAVLRAQLLKTLMETRKLKAEVSEKTSPVNQLDNSGEGNSAPIPETDTIPASLDNETTQSETKPTATSENDKGTKRSLDESDTQSKEEEGRRKEAEMRENILKKMKQNARNTPPPVTKKEPTIAKVNTNNLLFLTVVIKT